MPASSVLFLSVSSSPTRPAVTREMVYARTRELAVRAGRTSLQIAQSDYEQARAEMTGESEMERQEAVLDTCHATA